MPQSQAARERGATDVARRQPTSDSLRRRPDVSPRQTAFGRSGRHESTGLSLGPARARSPAHAGLSSLGHSSPVPQPVPRAGAALMCNPKRNSY
ncbi:hypothetical protein ACFX16_019984 [Malus domestica]